MVWLLSQFLPYVDMLLIYFKYRLATEEFRSNTLKISLEKGHQYIQHMLQHKKDFKRGMIMKMIIFLTNLHEADFHYIFSKRMHNLNDEEKPLKLMYLVIWTPFIYHLIKLTTSIKNINKANKRKLFSYNI